MNLKNQFRFRVIFESREFYRVIDHSQNQFSAELAGKLRHQEGALWPAVGDYVTGVPQPGGWVVISQVVDRHSVLQRRDPSGSAQVLAANVDTLFIVTSANQDLNLNRLERYITLALSGNVQPVIVINKIELATEPQDLLDFVAERFPNVDILGASAHEGWNLDALTEYAAGPEQTVAFVGSSGVGKSTLCNALLGADKAHTQSIREEDGRGRHTTTHRELHITPLGAVVIDTPGIRTVGLTEDANLGGAFADIEELARRCKFTDCRHVSEPGCAIITALDEGTLLHERWENYIKLGKELAHEQRKTNKALQAEEKKKWAKIHMANRERMKMRK